ncbi:MAG: hypothetical protein ABSG83_01340 [Roseiarcus sp.]|jgi:hypothetical protein
MDIFLAFLYALTCTALIYAMASSRELIFSHLGVVAVFSMMYCPIAVLLKSMSYLRDYSSEEIAGALAIHWIFLLAIVCGVAISWSAMVGVRPLGFGRLDELSISHMFTLALVSAVLYFLYFYMNDVSSYSSGNVQVYFEEKDYYRQILSAFSGLSVATIALAFAYALKQSRRAAAAILAALIAMVVVTALSTGARLLIITPLLMVFAALVMTGQRARAFQTMGAVLVILVVVSPIVVFMRENRGAVGSKSEVLSAASGFRFGADRNIFDELMQSVIDRSDLVYVTINMKDLIDRTDYVGWQFYYSVAVAPIPRFIYPDKPFVLSDNGRIDGEISVLAWRSLVGGLGSLTAFGGLVAYREGGWFAVILDGVAAGALFLFLSRWLGRGGFIARLFYLNIFVQIAAAKAPASFFEALASVLGLAPLMLIVFVISRSGLFVRAAPSRRLA